MKFENFSGTPDAGKKTSHHEEVVRTTASQGTRRDANADPSEGVRFESYEEEYEYLHAELARVRERLTGYNTTAFAKAQSKVRSEALTEQESIKKWLALRGEMQHQKDRLGKRLLEIQLRLTLIKPKLHQERLASSNKAPVKHNPAFQEMIDLLKEIRDLLKEPRTEKARGA